MLKIINEELFSFRPTSNTSQTGHTIHYLSLYTSNKIVVPEHHRSKQTMDRETGIEPTEEVHYIPINRDILKISFWKSNVLEENAPMSMKVSEPIEGIPSVELRCLSDDRDNRANVYVVAFPFNGMLKPIPESPIYRIYKGTLCASKKGFFFNGKKYRKVLYLVIEPNLNLFKEDHKYHHDSIPLTLESFAIYQKDGEEKTNHETFTMTVTNGCGDYTTEWDFETIDSGVHMDAEVGSPLWTTFKFAKKKYDGVPAEPNKILPKKNKEHPMQRVGNMYVTTNRHGIRKEIPLETPDNRRDRRGSHSNRFEHDDDDYGSKNRRKGKPSRFK